MENQVKRYEQINDKKVSYGVMFSDLECTLIGGGKEKLETWELYEKAFYQVAGLIDTILSFNNYFVIVSSVHHDLKERIARKFNYIYSRLSDENKDKIRFFISDVSEDSDENISSKEDDKTTEWKFEDISVMLIDEKSECVDIVLEDLVSKGIDINTIVGVGDDEKDVEMLFRIQELGGSVATIAERESYLTNCFSFPEINEFTYKDIVKKIVDQEYSIDENLLCGCLMKQQKCESFSSVLRFIKDSPDYKEIQDKKGIRIDELISLYESGEVDDLYLQRCLYNAELAYRYFYRYQYNDSYQVGYGEELLNKITSISLYHSSKSLSNNEQLLDLPKIKQLLMSRKDNE